MPTAIMRAALLKHRTTISDVQPGTVRPEKCETRARKASSIATSVMIPAPTKLIFKGRAENDIAPVHASRIIFRRGYFVSPATPAWTAGYRHTVWTSGENHPHPAATISKKENASSDKKTKP